MSQRAGEQENDEGCHCIKGKSDLHRDVSFSVWVNPCWKIASRHASQPGARSLTEGLVADSGPQTRALQTNQSEVTARETICSFGTDVNSNSLCKKGQSSFFRRLHVFRLKIVKARDNALLRSLRLPAKKYLSGSLQAIKHLRYSTTGFRDCIIVDEEPAEDHQQDYQPCASTLACFRIECMGKVIHHRGTETQRKP